MKKEGRNKWLRKIPIELKTGLIVGLLLTPIILIIMFVGTVINSPNSQFLFNPNTLFLLIFRIIIPIFILFFICGVILGFFSRIIHFFLKKRFK